MSVVITIQYNEFDKVSGKAAVRKTQVFRDVETVAPFGDSFVALTQNKENKVASLLIPCVRIYTLHILESNDAPTSAEEKVPEIYVPNLRAVSDVVSGDTA